VTANRVVIDGGPLFAHTHECEFPCAPDDVFLSVQGRLEADEGTEAEGEPER
jgi:hypothetical protein